MDDTLLIDAVERFLNGEMSPEESYFEEIRKNNPDVDQAVVEQIFFIHELVISSVVFSRSLSCLLTSPATSFSWISE